MYEQLFGKIKKFKKAQFNRVLCTCMRRSKFCIHVMQIPEIEDREGDNKIFEKNNDSKLSKIKDINL